MEASTTNTTTPPAAAASKRRRKAALPLGDLTNLLPSTPAPRNPSAKRPLRPPRPDASASATPVSKASSAAAVEEPGLVKSPISTIYTSRATRGRRNPTSVKVPFPTGAVASCPPLGKTTRASSHSTKKAPAAQDPRPISSSAPCHQAKKKRHLGVENSSSGRPKLPDDFVEKHKAYFQEIDAFELPVEEVSETD
ncbi:mediator of DNA damage checkpoint protein 1-like isoform X2 [Triticum dicoccoides]|uniref:mediator of DNA damage checkpoint protein 1-like isoform X2 n=1 Tax=Triticum dicoccoides TaxID=85692 RepID=UPI00188F8FA5|nr:mediator of DNA damage checkpoint protein 1-like isoform X2 [Triticum dicoccoides]XP_044372540.1 mediator of DNA damage checkpoint protein 1-like isoform X2 [Triticum aestivum]